MLNQSESSLSLVTMYTLIPIRPLLDAIKEGNIEEIKRLLDLGFDPNYIDDEYKNESTRILNDMLERDPIPKPTPLLYAVQKGNVVVIKALLEAGSGAGVGGEDGTTIDALGLEAPAPAA